MRKTKDELGNEIQVIRRNKKRYIILYEKGMLISKDFSQSILYYENIHSIIYTSIPRGKTIILSKDFNKDMFLDNKIWGYLKSEFDYVNDKLALLKAERNLEIENLVC